MKGAALIVSMSWATPEGGPAGKPPMDKLASLLHMTPAVFWMVAKVIIVFSGVMALASVWTWVDVEDPP